MNVLTQQLNSPSPVTPIDWSDCASARADLPVEDMIRLIESAPPGPWPCGWAKWENVIIAHQRLAEQAISQLRPDRIVYPQQRGIVIAGGGLKYFPSVWVNVNLIRCFGCELPIQLWYLGESECDPYLKRLLARTP